MAAFNAGKYALPLGKKTYVMGILNVTPDSFSDGGEYNTPEKAVSYALEMQAKGADIIDLGANSTRPGANLLTSEQECERLEPYLASLRGKLNVPLSVDTFYPDCALLALKYGADIINDVSGAFSGGAAEAASRAKAGYVAVHNPCGAGKEAIYENGVVAAVRAYFIECIEFGFPDGCLCLDPGLGFSKSAEDNLTLLREAAWLKFTGIPLLYGASRKRFLGKVSGVDNPAFRDNATVAAHVAAIAGGADIIRTHNVALGVESTKIADAVFRGEN